LKAVSYQDEKLKMPPTDRLSDEKISVLAKWMQLGAPWPEYKPAVQSSETLWSLKPIRSPAPPVVRNRSWVRSPIDAFVLNKLETKGLSPAPPAGKRDLIRRAYFDLIGLPPSP